MTNQYIGVTGFMSRDEVEQVLAQLPQAFDKQLMVGMLVSDKTLFGLKNKFPNRYAEPRDIESLFIDHPRVLNLIHYNTKKESNYDIVQEMGLIEFVTGDNCHGFQLNLVWPHPEIIRNWRIHRMNKNNDGIIVLQCGANAMSQLGNNPSKIVEKLKSYEGIVDYVLLDPSGGTGKSLDPDYIIRCLGALYSSTLKMKCGVAGGFGPSTLQTLLAPIAQRFPQVSVDAESRIRTKEDHLDIPAAVLYIHQSHQMLR